MEHIKRLNEMETPVQAQEEYPVYYVVKRFVYDREHKNGWWREEEMFDSVPACENYIKASSYKAKGETGRFGIYKTQLIKLVGEE